MRYIDELSHQYIENPEMINSVKYCLINDSKKLRSIMIMIFAEIFEINLENITNYILAVEIAHTYTLIHDDLPVLDNDDFRRGKPSAHKKFGEANAILLGDAMQSLAFELISQENKAFSAQQILKAVNLFAKHIGGIEGVIYGEYLDINSIDKLLLDQDFDLNLDSRLNLKQICKIHLYKTAKLFEFCSLICGILTNCNEYVITDLRNFGINYGLAFQLLDDLDDYDEFFEETKKKYEVNILTILNKNDAKVLYTEYMDKIYSTIEDLIEKKYPNLEKLKRFVDETLNFP
jgi:geranylgeranyl pyrophosphate synthase